MTSFSITREPKLDNSANGKYKRRVEGKGLGEFVGVDGEGAGYGRDHTYVLLGIGDRYIENIEGITWREAFEFLYGVFQESPRATRSEEHTSELQSRRHLVCRLLLEK